MSKRPQATPARGRAPASVRSSPAVILVSLLLYFVGDRLTPYTTQARIQAFVVPVAAEVAGKFSKVYIRNNDEVQPGQPLFDIDPKPYEIALQRARADYASVRSSVKASVAGVDAARASLAAAQAHVKWPKATPPARSTCTRRIQAPFRCAVLRVRRRPARKRAQGPPRRGRSAQGAGGRW